MPVLTEAEIEAHDLATVLDMQSGLARLRKVYYKLVEGDEAVDDALVRLKAVLEHAEMDLVERQHRVSTTKYMQQKLLITEEPERSP